MSKGMWTKHYTEDGKIFYFNAAQNRSVWTTPFDAIIHEAPNLQKPTERGTEVAVNEEESPMISAIPQVNISEALQTYIPVVAPQAPIVQYLPSQMIDIQPIPTSVNHHQDDLNSKRNNELLLEMQAKIDQALIQKQKEITAKKQAQKKLDSE